MVEKQSLPVTRTKWLSLALLIAVLTTGAFFNNELHWAAVQLPQYINGTIPPPLERVQLSHARKLLYSGFQLDYARELLQASRSIDPYTDATFLLAESYRLQGDTQKATTLYATHLRFDETHVEARRMLVEAYIKLGKRDQALTVSQVGVAVFTKRVDQFRPMTDDQVDTGFNRKAIRVYANYVKAQQTFNRLVIELSQSSASSVDVGDTGG